MSAEMLSPTEALTRLFVTADSDVGESRAAASFERRYGFHIGGYRFLHDVFRPVELCDLLPCYGLPNVGAWFPGLVNLRGILVPVFDLKVLLGVAPTADTRHKLLCIGTGNNFVGLLIDGNPVELTIDVTKQEADHSFLPEVLRQHTHAVYEHDGQLWIDPDYDEFFQTLATRTEA